MRILLASFLLILIANSSFSDHADSNPLLWSPEGSTSFSYKFKSANVEDCVEAWSKGNILEKEGYLLGLELDVPWSRMSRGAIVLVAYKNRVFQSMKNIYTITK